MRYLLVWLGVVFFCLMALCSVMSGIMISSVVNSFFFNKVKVNDVFLIPKAARTMTVAVQAMLKEISAKWVVWYRG